MATENDLISRKAFLEDIENRYCKPCKESRQDYNEVRCRACWVDDMQGEIETAPAVEAETVKHGNWIVDEEGLDEDGNGQYRCSHCGVGEKHNPTVTVSYCWNCGTKMDGERSEGE